MELFEPAFVPCTLRSTKYLKTKYVLVCITEASHTLYIAWVEVSYYSLPEACPHVQSVIDFEKTLDELLYNPSAPLHWNGPDLRGHQEKTQVSSNVK